MPSRLAKLFSGRVHYAWVVLARHVHGDARRGRRARRAGVMIVPLQHAFGWDVSTISGAVSLNIILLGATGPFLTGLMQVIGLKRTILACLAVLMAGTGLSMFMTDAVAAVPDLGADGRYRIGRRRGRHGGGGSEPLVRPAHRPWPWGC